MANKKGKNVSKAKNKQDTTPNLNQPWLSMRSGIIIIAITSIAMAVLTAVQSVPSVGLVEGILWGLLFGGMIWVIFFGFYYLRRFLGRKG